MEDIIYEQHLLVCEGVALLNSLPELSYDCDNSITLPMFGQR
jgi:hypothetical protein